MEQIAKKQRNSNLTEIEVSRAVLIDFETARTVNVIEKALTRDSSIVRGKCKYLALEH